MFLTYCAYGALIICLVGIGYRMGRWLVLPLGPEAEDTALAKRALGALGAVAKALLQPRGLIVLLRTLLMEVILQIHILRQDPRRWVMHMALFYGMLLLLLMHVFDDRITARLFPDYASTLNPFMFLRNLLGVLVMVGVIIAWVRRRADRTLRRTMRGADRWLLVLLSGIILTGAALEAVQIISPTLFDEMVVDYMDSDDPEEIAPLKAYWAAKFDVAFAPMPSTDDPELLDEGRSLHAEYCAECHSRPGSAVLSYPLALALKPFSAWITDIGLETALWYAHYLIGCLALALLPFSKSFHLVSTPLSLVSRALGSAATDRPVNRPTRRALGLDACTHCGVCTLHCAVGPIFQVIPNADILPSEKLHSVARMAAGRSSAHAQARLSEGSFICTGCGRCTAWCPSGIDLQDMWAASISDLGRRGYPQAHGWMRRHSAPQWAEILKACPDTLGEQAPLRQPLLRLTDNPDTFWACVQCSTCTNVCPVVAISEDPQRDLDLTPQQVMNLMRLQLKETAIGSRMVWDCVTCYKCQEHCPQGVRVADVLYELRNEACRRLTPADRASDPGSEQHILATDSGAQKNGA